MMTWLAEHIEGILANSPDLVEAGCELVFVRVTRWGVHAHWRC